MTDSDQKLIARAQEGDRIAFQQLLERHYQMIYRIAYRFAGSRQDAEDIAQEVCVGLVHKLGAFRGDSSFGTWLYRVVVNTCRDMQKSRRAHRSLEQKYTELEQLHVAEASEANKKAAWLYREITKLEPALKETALLVLSEELSHAEAGEILNCAESTISWRMSEIRKQLKHAMGDYHD